MPVLPFSEITSQRLQELVAYWTERAAGGVVPRRSAIDPVDIPALLPALSLVELVGPERQIRFRVYGTEIARSFGYDLTARTLEEADISAERTVYWQAIYWRIADTAQPLYGRDRAAVRDFISFEWAKLPLSSEGGTVDLILCGYDFVSDV